jgi:uncharacterized OsmC-like protein
VFRVKSLWQGQARSRAEVESYSVGSKKADHTFAIDIDEPFELLGENTAPNPQEVLMSALNACVMVGCVVGAAAKGITLVRLEIEIRGELDLRGFLGIDASVRPGYEKIHYVVHIKGRRYAGAVSQDPRNRDEDFAELLQHHAACSDRRRAAIRIATAIERRLSPSLWQVLAA